MAKRTSDSIKAHIVDQYRRGVNVTSLADKYAISVASIYKWAKDTKPAVAPIDNSTLHDNDSDIWEQLDAYWEVLHRSGLADKSIEDYYYFAECFVRWTEGSFTPGSAVKQN